MEIKWQFFILAIILTVSSVSAKGNCKVCDSTTDDKCQTEPASLEDKPCEAENCFTLVDNNGKIKRGCVSETDTCDGKNCKTCTANDTSCNTQTDLFWCKLCDSSSATDCAFWQSESSIPHEICAAGVTKCVMEIKDDKHTYRRCASKSDEACESGKKCDICSSDKGCNKGIFPNNRLKCYQCNSDKDSKCATPTKYTTDIKSFPCLFYNESDKCFEHGSSDTNMVRGCLSDTTAYEKCSSESPKDKCKECTADNCNVDEYKIEATSKCIQCKSEKDAKCVGAHTADLAEKCVSKIEYWKSQDCYINKIDGKVDRGCIQDFDCSSASTCTSCTNNGTVCNIADQTKTSCYKCRSDVNAKCALPLVDDSFKSEQCRNQINIDGGEQCYIEKWNDIIIRSCLSDADAKSKKNCLDSTYKFCNSCKGDNCNSGAVPDSAQSIVLASSGLFALTLIVLKFF
ncbi:uncharacterized protein LOC129949843 [Eupeodes corollae]|uniref:uncharacterized protein LOC129949843 n=1 Tax=Eupeodes corollae TaxID=290404 RepID=UPI00248F8D1C|nr:uncharacterized protein LOC129949843 [Eupeodes corollae]